MADNYILDETSILDGFTGESVHQQLDYIIKNKEAINEKNTLKYIDININIENWSTNGIAKKDISENLKKLYESEESKKSEPKDYTEKNFHIIAFPFDDSTIDDLEYHEGTNYSTYNNYNVRCVKFQNPNIYFKADGIPNSNLIIRLLCIYQAKNQVKEEVTQDGNN